MRQRTKAASPIHTGARAFVSTVLVSRDSPVKVICPQNLPGPFEPENFLFLRWHTLKVSTFTPNERKRENATSTLANQRRSQRETHARTEARAGEQTLTLRGSDGDLRRSPCTYPSLSAAPHTCARFCSSWPTRAMFGSCSRLNVSKQE